MHGNKDRRPTVELSPVSEPKHPGLHAGAPLNVDRRDKTKKTSNVAVPVAAAIPEVASGVAPGPGPRPSEPHYGSALLPAAYPHKPSGGESVVPPTYVPKVGGSAGPGSNSAPNNPARPGESTTTIDMEEHPDGSKTVITVTRTLQPDGTIVQDVITSTTAPPPTQHGMAAHSTLAYDQVQQQNIGGTTGSITSLQQQQLYPPPPQGSEIGGVSSISGVSGGQPLPPSPPPPGIIYHPEVGAAVGVTTAPPVNADAGTPPGKPPAPEKEGCCASKRHQTIAIVAAVVVVLGGVGAALGLTLGRGGNDGGYAAAAETIEDTPFDLPVFDLHSVGPPGVTNEEEEGGKGDSVCAKFGGENLFGENFFCQGLDEEDGGRADLEFCFERSADRSQCNLWFTDTGSDADMCCRGCTVCPLGCNNTVGIDCSNLGEGMSYGCECEGEGTLATTLPPSPQPTPTPTSPPSPQPTPANSVCAKFGGEDLFCHSSNEEKDGGDGMGDLEVCLERSADQSQCNLWLTDNGSDTDICCGGCTVCPPGCNNTFGIDCSYLGGGLSIGCECEGEGTPVPTPPPSTQPTPANSVCTKFGGEDLFCQGLEEEEDGDGRGVEVCLERSANQSQCNLWLTDTGSDTDICCRGCTVCPPGCNNTIGIDCSNLGEGLSVGCGCKGEIL